MDLLSFGHSGLTLKQPKGRKAKLDYRAACGFSKDNLGFWFLNCRFPRLRQSEGVLNACLPSCASRMPGPSEIHFSGAPRCVSVSVAALFQEFTGCWSPCWCGALIGGTGSLTPLLCGAVGSAHACCCLIPQGTLMSSLYTNVKTSLNSTAAFSSMETPSRAAPGTSHYSVDSTFAQTRVSYAAIPPG